MRILLLAPLLLSACASDGTMTPEQYQAIQRALDNVRQPSTYQIVQPQPLLAPPARIGPAASCRTYRNLAGQIQTDCY